MCDGMKGGGGRGWRDLIILFLNLFPYLCKIFMFTTDNIIFFIHVILFVF